MRSLPMGGPALLLCLGVAQAAIAQVVLPLSKPVQNATTAVPYRITGVLLNRVTGAPVRHGTISPTRVEAGAVNQRRVPAPLQRAETDEHGHFVVTLPASGRWALTASAPGFRPQGYEQHEGYSSAVVLTAQKPTCELRYALVPDAAITGIVLDEGSEPVRQAQIQVLAVGRAGADGNSRILPRGFAMTDDRGRYEVDGLAPGDYRVSVQGRPWYATASQGSRAGTGLNQPDPMLDVVYPLTWYPGGTDPHAAQTLKLQEGEMFEADVQLQPIPSVHLRIPLPLPEPGATAGARGIRYPMITPVEGSGGMAMSSSIDGQGQMEVAGLAPGVYRVQTPDELGRPGHSTIVEIGANGSRTVDLAAAAHTATVHIGIEGPPGAESLPLTWIAADSSMVFRSAADGADGGLRRRQPAGNTVTRSGAGSETVSGDPPTRTLELPPGRYSVYQNGSNDFYLASLMLGQQPIAGRSVMIPEGISALTVTFGEGRAQVHGIANAADGIAGVGAMVLLVPATMGVPGSIAEVLRDQTNTDGSFDFNAVIPSEYILLAIDQGWKLRWDDPATLSRYLLKGVPLDLRRPATLTQDVQIQLP